MFSLVHSITDNTWAVAAATRDVIREFAADGVVYLELRTTPREVPGRMTREAYCRAVLDTIRAVDEEGQQQFDKSDSSSGNINSIMVRLLLAVDRRRLNDFEDTVKLFLQLREASYYLAYAECNIVYN
jgi:adenosine deaminase